MKNAKCKYFVNVLLILLNLQIYCTCISASFCCNLSTNCSDKSNLKLMFYIHCCLVYIITDFISLLLYLLLKQSRR